MNFIKENIFQLFLSEESKPQLMSMTHLWKIENYSKILSTEPKSSSDFKVGEDSYRLEISKDEHITVLLRQLKSCESITKFLCSTGLVDRHGKLCHFQRREAEMSKSSNSKVVLEVPCRVLEHNKADIIPMNSLSIQLNINLLTGENQLPPCDGEQSLETLSFDLGKLHEDKTDYDVVLKAGAVEYKAHRLVLAARSPTFAQMFRQKAKERPKEYIDIKDVNFTILGNILYYIYTGKVQGVTSNTASTLVEAADKYQLPELKTMCTSFLGANLTMENICDAVLVAERFRDEVLENAAFAFMCENAEEVINSDQWTEFKIKHPEIANSVLSSVLLSVQKRFVNKHAASDA